MAVRPPRRGGLHQASVFPDGLNESELVAIAIELGARSVGKLTDLEEELTVTATDATKSIVESIRKAIESGKDALGQSLCDSRSPSVRRALGAVYTPMPIVRAMISIAKEFGEPQRIVDAGVGTGRFLLAAARIFKKASLVGIECDPTASLLARANVAVRGLQPRTRIIQGDYRNSIEPFDGRTLYIGNPPYVRHHRIGSDWKEWLTRAALKFGINASQLAGLHAHFFLATAIAAKPGDTGVFITSAEWLDVNYGKLMRKLFLGSLGGERIDIIEPSALPFPGTATTGAITAFRVGAKPNSVSFRRVASVARLRSEEGRRSVRRERLESEDRWSHLCRPLRKNPDGFVELGELCRVHRGQVTGSNRVWIEGQHCSDLPEDVLYPTVTRANDLFRAGGVLDSSIRLRRVIDLPADLDQFGADDRRKIDKFLNVAKRMGADKGYVATQRKAWWSVGLREPAPILATYMARRPPAFVKNKVDARHINIAHGIYPRDKLSDEVIARLAAYLSTSVRLFDGRTYAGGLTKFEPREMERLIVPSIELLHRSAK